MILMIDTERTPANGLKRGGGSGNDKQGLLEKAISATKTPTYFIGIKFRDTDRSCLYHGYRDNPPSTDTLEPVIN